MKYIFVKNINKTKQSGIIDTDSQKLLCICLEDTSKIILKALNKSNVSKSCLTCLFSKNGKTSCFRYMSYAPFKINHKILGNNCGADNGYSHYIPFFS